MLFFLTLQESTARQRILQAAKLCVCIAAEGLDGSFPFITFLSQIEIEKSAFTRKKKSAICTSSISGTPMVNFFFLVL